MEFLVKYSSVPVWVSEDVLELLRSANAHEASHSGGRTLVDHVAGVYGLMRLLHCTRDACQAALVHSIYSTDAFETQCLPLDQRGRVAEVMGERAEHLAYLFCAMDRASFVYTPVSPGDYFIYDRFRDGERVTISKGDYYDLCDLLLVNEMEQMHPRTRVTDPSTEFVDALLERCANDAIIFYKRVFQRNATEPPPEAGTGVRFAREMFLHYAGDPKYPQAPVLPALLDTSLHFHEHDPWDQWLSVHHESRVVRVAVAPDCDYRTLQRQLTAALGLDPRTHCVLGLCERLTGPVLTLDLIAKHGPWALLPETQYAAAVIDATPESRAAHDLDASDLVPPDPSSLLPPRFEWTELQAALARDDPESMALLRSFADVVHEFGCGIVRMPVAYRAVCLDAVAESEAFFDAPLEAKRDTNLEFAERKFVGHATNAFREWFQVRTVFDLQAVNKSYAPYPELSRKLLRLHLLLEAVSRDVVAMLCKAIGMPPHRILDLCDPPGLPPVLASALGMEPFLEADMSSVWDRMSAATATTTTTTAAGEESSAFGEASAEHQHLADPEHAHDVPVPMDVDGDSGRPANAPLGDERGGGRSSGAARPVSAWKRSEDDFPGSNVMRFFRYHTGKTDADREAFAKGATYPSSPHADMGIVTVAPCSLNPSLEVQSAKTNRLVNVEENSDPARDFSIMIAENFGFLTRGYFRAVFHRVVPNYTHLRYSMPFFLRAHPRAVCNVPEVCRGVECLQGAVPEGHDAREVTVAHVMDHIVQSRSLGYPQTSDW